MPIAGGGIVSKSFVDLKPTCFNPFMPIAGGGISGSNIWEGKAVVGFNPFMPIAGGGI